ncbi:vitamin K epoxide reductase complex subunit 1-like protein 1 [Patella vulgata]|uniref:vitamin K epoxide reductase complex subunit 1-like protein 1 n=1 Tax=Patella vulgata TaxID=6465 RepID=UPI00217FDCE8|nr:vitamin K epoxide reductase complex subunit 1-like protein 1 [Patella vulgata]
MTLDYLLFSNIVDRLLINLLGICVSMYALRIELKKEADPTYRAACDFNSRMSCSKVLTSKYSKGFGIVGVLFGEDHLLNQRNCNLGILFYTVQILLAFLPNPAVCSRLLLCCSIAGGIGSVYLALILFIVLKDVCLVCITTYIINGALMYLNYSLYKNFNMASS